MDSNKAGLVMPETQKGTDQGLALHARVVAEELLIGEKKGFSPETRRSLQALEAFFTSAMREEETKETPKMNQISSALSQLRGGDTINGSAWSTALEHRLLIREALSQGQFTTDKAKRERLARFLDKLVDQGQS